MHLLLPEAELSQTSSRLLVQRRPQSHGSMDIGSETGLLENALLSIVEGISLKVGDCRGLTPAGS